MELADHKNVTIDTGLEVYFADPRSPWQCGTNKKTNRLLRHYLPKGATMARRFDGWGSRLPLEWEGPNRAPRIV